MNFPEGKDKFIHSWGTLGSNWGINRTMAQIHALLLIAPEAMNAEEIRDELQISMGNANMNLRALIDWGLVYKELKTGERKDFFVAEKDMLEIVKKIIQQRKKKELEPLTKVLDELSSVQAEDQQSAEFVKVMNEIKLFSSKTDTLLERISTSDGNWLFGTFLGLIK
jgi:DNA-binding transcriptional regulator GbsR (MarR family)